MAEYSYQAIKGKTKTFLAMTGIDLGEFTQLLPYFHQAYREQLVADGHDSQTKRGRPSHLVEIEDKLFFILFYLKTYPLQEVISYSFNLSQGVANRWIHRLSHILQLSLKSMGHAPARLPEEVLERLSRETPQALGLDATERRIQRPIDRDVQKEYYRGKKKFHSVKNNVIAGLEDREIKYLGKTRRGKDHDKRIADEEGVKVPVGYHIYRDLGYQGHHPGDEAVIHQPKKKPRGKPLSEKDKTDNRAISSIRVVIEHVNSGIKRCRCVKDIFRNYLQDFDDVVMEIACGLHNLRTSVRIKSY